MWCARTLHPRLSSGRSPREPIDDVGEVVDRLGAFDLRDERRRAARRLQQRTRLLDVVGRLDERDREEIGLKLGRQHDVGAVLVRERGDREPAAEPVDALAIREAPAGEHDAPDLPVGGVDDFERDQAVVEQQHVARVHVLPQIVVADADARRVARRRVVAAVERERLLRLELHRPVRETLDAYGLHAIPKTSGASGIHIMLPLPAGIPNDGARIVAELVATAVANRYPKIATIERWTKQRPSSAVYVDFLQNIRGKTVAGVYSVRAEPTATVSTPLRWDEIRQGLDPKAFTMDAVVERIDRVGDLWGDGMKRPRSRHLTPCASCRPGPGRPTRPARS